MWSGNGVHDDYKWLIISTVCRESFKKYSKNGLVQTEIPVLWITMQISPAGDFSSLLMQLGSFLGSFGEICLDNCQFAMIIAMTFGSDADILIKVTWSGPNLCFMTNSLSFGFQH